MFKLLKKIASNPVYYLRVSIAIVKGTLYIVFYKITKPNVTIRFPLIAFSSLRITGSGRVYIGKKCVIAENVFKGLSIVTLNKTASVYVEDFGCMLAGLTIRCSHKVTIGRGTMTAVSLVQDCDFVNSDRIGKDVGDELLRSEEIVLGRNSWIGGVSIILKGSKIGDDSVVSAGSLLRKISIEDYNLCSGNPTKRGLSIQKLLAMRS